MIDFSQSTALKFRTYHSEPILAQNTNQAHVKRLYLINPSNSSGSILNIRGHGRSNRFSAWKPLGLMVIAGLTPDDWEITIIDENLGIPDYATMSKPDLVGITLFSSQASRAYELSSYFRLRGIPVILGGIHATMCRKEASMHADAVVTGKAESIWAKVLDDVRHNRLQPLYEGGPADLWHASGPARSTKWQVRLWYHANIARLSSALQFLRQGFDHIQKNDQRDE